MKTKKLVDSESSHSDMLTSLIRALEECDSDTEQHVRRTQEMGAELGRRIELSDIQQSKLALLCLLHDIGKVGVPMEILNKPGKLTDEEWKIMRSHVEKGYEIAMSNTELRQISYGQYLAGMISALPEKERNYRAMDIMEMDIRMD